MKFEKKPRYTLDAMKDEWTNIKIKILLIKIVSVLMSLNFIGCQKN